MSIEGFGVEGDQDAVERWFRQRAGNAEPEYPKGKLNPDDEGALAFAIAIDPKKKLMIINFNKPVTWLGLYLPDARNLHEKMGQRIKELEDLDKPTEQQSTNTESSS